MSDRLAPNATILTEGFDRCPHCNADPPPGVTAAIYEDHLELCKAGLLGDGIPIWDLHTDERFDQTFYGVRCRSCGADFGLFADKAIRIEVMRNHIKYCPSPPAPRQRVTNLEARALAGDFEAQARLRVRNADPRGG